MKDSHYSYGQRLTIGIVPPLVAFLLRLLHRTLRYEIVLEPGVEEPRPPALQVWCFWHRCLIPCACYFYGHPDIRSGEVQPAILISLSFDGELVARTIERLGFLTARGSSTRHGGSGLMTLAKAVEQGHPPVFTADGPRGPLYKAKPGAVKLAQFTGCAIASVYAHPQKAWLLRSWDRLIIPKPFSRVAVSWGRHIEVPLNRGPAADRSQEAGGGRTLERVRLNAEQHFLRQ